MKLKARLDTLDEVPENLQPLYTQIGEEYVLDIDDGGFKKRLSEFRTNNIEYRRKMDEMQAKLDAFGDIDPDDIEQLRAAQKRVQELEDKKLLDENKVEEVLQRRTERMRQEHEGRVESLTKQISDLTSQRDVYRDKLGKNQLAKTILDAVHEIGVPRKGANRDILARAAEDWQIDENGELRPLRDGKVLFGVDGQNPITPQEWARGLSKEAEWLFEPNTGGGARGGASGSNGSGGVIRWEDQDAVNANLEAIAEGKVLVER